MKLSNIPQALRLQKTLADLKLAQNFDAIDIHISVRSGDRHVTINPDVLGALFDETKVRQKLVLLTAKVEAELAAIGAEP